MRFVIVNGMDGLMHVHAAGCADIKRELRDANGSYTREASDAKTLVAHELRSFEQQDMSMTENDFHVAPCAMGVR